MFDPPSISRRQVLAAAGGAATGIGGYVAGARTADSVPDGLAGRDCAPSALARSPTDWPFPRHDRANTGHAPGRAGPDWPLDLAWERELPVGDDPRTSPLVVADGVVIILVDSDPGNVLLGISLADGRVVWRRRVENARYGRVAAAGGTAFVDAMVPDSPAPFAARSLGDGAVLWTADVDLTDHMVSDGRLLAVDRSPEAAVVTARDARTGVECWRATASVGRPTDLAVAEGQVVMSTYDHGTHAFGVSSGDRTWRSEEGGDTAAVVDGWVVSKRFAGELKTLSLADGTVEWRVQSDRFLEDGEGDDGTRYARPGFEVGAVTSRAIVYALEVYSNYPGRLQARSLETGELLWDVGPEPVPVEFHGYSRPIAVGEDVLAVRHARRESGDLPDALLRLDVATGAERDRITFPTNEDVHPPVVADSTLLVPTSERLIAYT